MATKKPVTEDPQDLEEIVEEAPKPRKVTLTIPRGAPDEPDIYISVNGLSVLIPRGRTVSVDPAIAMEYNRSVRAQLRAEAEKARRAGLKKQ